MKNPMRPASSDVKDVSCVRVLCAASHETGGVNQHGPRKQVQRAATLSLPPDGSFDDDDACWIRAKFLRENNAYTWIPHARLGDF